MNEIRGSVAFGDVRAIRGPLIFVGGVEAVGFDEVAEITLPSGETRHGVVLEVEDDIAVVQVYEGPAGIGVEGPKVRFAGTPLEIAVGEEWVGRVCNGRGEPIDGGPPVFARDRRPVVGAPVNPARRAAPADPIVTGVSAIDALATLVRGQKLPVFSHGGLPHLELAAQIAVQAHTRGETFRLVFCAMGVTHADAEMVTEILESRAAEGELTLFVNTADDPVVERLVAPRIALTVAEHLAFDLDYQVLVIMADMTSYCEAVREVSATRGDIPGRRGYPGFLYSDLASLYERSGRLRDRSGSLTQLPVLTMPGGDLTHPIPDLTGYITEGQLVLSPDLYARGVDPPLDALASLSRLMRLGVGPDQTRDDHMAVAGQLYASLARARQAADLSELVGPDALSETDRRFMAFAAALERDFMSQGRVEERSLEKTLDMAWTLLSMLPRRELTMIPNRILDERYEGKL